MLGARPGTPGFMAPEQITTPQDVGPRADVYALACVAYFALTGTVVFAGSVDGQILFAHVEVDPDSPSDRNPGGLLRTSAIAGGGEGPRIDNTGGAPRA